VTNRCTKDVWRATFLSRETRRRWDCKFFTLTLDRRFWYNNSRFEIYIIFEKFPQMCIHTDGRMGCKEGARFATDLPSCCQRYFSFPHISTIWQPSSTLSPPRRFIRDTGKSRFCEGVSSEGRPMFLRPSPRRRTWLVCAATAGVTALRDSRVLTVRRTSTRTELGVAKLAGTENWSNPIACKYALGIAH